MDSDGYAVWVCCKYERYVLGSKVVRVNIHSLVAVQNPRKNVADMGDVYKVWRYLS